MRILIIEDDQTLCDALKSQLLQNGYDVDLCTDGNDAPFYIGKENADLILLDRMLPGMDGLTILKMIRQKHIQAPVILATAMNQIHDRIEGLDSGADDYIVKPYDVKELMARIRALTRRPIQMQDTSILTYLDLSMDLKQHAVIRGNSRLTLSKKEASLFEYFLRNPEKTLSRELLMDYVWGADCSVEEGNLDNYIHFLRKRLRALGSPAVLRTVHGVGYRLEPIS